MLPADLDRLSHAELKDLVLKLLGEVAELRRTVDAQRDEIARLKGGPGRPNIKPSGMEKATEPKVPPTAGGEPRQKGSKTSKLTIHEERTVKLKAPPQGSRFKGYTSYVVQDLTITPHVVKFRRERWQTANGETMTPPLQTVISGASGDAPAVSGASSGAHFIGRGGALLGGLRKCVACSKPCAIWISRPSLHGRPKMSIPIGTPRGAVAVGFENPAGTVMAGKPVTDARIPLRSA